MPTSQAQSVRPGQLCLALCTLQTTTTQYQSDTTTVTNLFKRLSMLTAVLLQQTPCCSPLWLWQQITTCTAGQTVPWFGRCANHIPRVHYTLPRLCPHRAFGPLVFAPGGNWGWGWRMDDSVNLLGRFAVHGKMCHMNPAVRSTTGRWSTWRPHVALCRYLTATWHTSFRLSGMVPTAVRQYADAAGSQSQTWTIKGLNTTATWPPSSKKYVPVEGIFAELCGASWLPVATLCTCNTWPAHISCLKEAE
jgi:hypothetical protein